MAVANHHILIQSKRAGPLVTPQNPSASHDASAVLVIRNDKGLHTRPSTELVRCATRFRSHIQLSYHGMTVNAKSLLGILMLAAGKNAKITVEATGVDADEAITALLDLAQNKFYISF
ncbi:MAG: HPr family phosphocarrier protein [Parachlamydiales bacterium]